MDRYETKKNSAACYPTPADCVESYGVVKHLLWNSERWIIDIRCLNYISMYGAMWLFFNLSSHTNVSDVDMHKFDTVCVYIWV